MPTPTPGADPVIDLVCQFFAGPYSAADHAYIASTIAGVGTWRRGWDKLDDFANYTRGAAAGSLTGTQIIVAPELGEDRRLTMPAVVGRKHASHQLALYCYFWSTAQYVEDTQDMVYAVRSAIIAALRSDPTCGTGGIEAGYFHVGVPDEHGSGGSITWQQVPPVTDDRGATKASMIIRFEAHEIPVG